jgi:hypothetical protein
MAVLFLFFSRIRVGELNESGGVAFVEIWVSVIVGGWMLPFIIMLVFFWPFGLWDVR